MVDRLFDNAIAGVVTLVVWRRRLRETTTKFFELVRTLDQRGR